jgi:hypothetical protein
MTKSGIGTQNSQSNGIGSTNGQTAMTNASTSTAATTTSTSNNTNANNVANAEIPIWVADKKKWVTGISKKTTVNDLIFAILKQCQIVGNAGASSNQLDQIANQYVLVEYQFEPDSSTNTPNNTSTNQQSSNSFVMTSQRIYNGDSKVYKYLNKWSQTTHSTSSLTQTTSTNTSNSNSNVMLKILQRESNSNELTQSNVNEADNNNHNNHSSSSLASKLLKKFGVSSNSSATNTPATNASSTNNSNATSKPNACTSNSYRYVDVKLPQQQQQTQPHVQTSSSNNLPAQTNQIVSPSSTSTLSSTTQNSNNLANRNAANQYDPNVQKTLLFNSIVEKENRLKQQIDRFQLIDELIKETEKKSKHNVLSSCTNNVLNQLSLQTPQATTTTASSSSPLSSSSATAATASLINNLSTNENALQTNLVDLNDIYCYFPEMCTHHLKEVEDFTSMCGQLFNLDEAIKSQKQLLNNLEFDLQRELNQQQQQQLQNQEPTRSQSAMNLLNETPETIELRQEVYMSREQTRLQCKQLHDLDLRMRQSEQSLMLKEQQLQQLLEELYIQEIYADNALESVINQNADNVPSGTTNLNMYRSPNSHVDLRELNKNQESDSNDQHAHINNLMPLTDERHTPFQNQIINEVLDNIPINNLNTQQKSHSIGNLTSLNPNPSTNHNVNMKNTNQINGHMVHMLNTLNPNFGNAKKLVGNNGCLIKPSPSLELNHLTNRTASIKINNQLNAHSQQSTHQPNSDQSGDNDSGISSMSSETTAAMNNANASGTGIPIIVQQNINARNVVTPNQMHMGNQHYQSKQIMYNANISQHQQYLSNQYQQHHNMMMLNNPSNNGSNSQQSKAAASKSVLETLV